MAEEIGGFWASLKLKPDEGSFSKGESALRGIATGLKRIAEVLIAGKIASEITKLAEAQAQLNVTAVFAGTGVNQLTQWALMVKTAGQDSAAFVQGLSNLNMAFTRLQLGLGDLPQNMAAALGYLKLDLGKIMGEDSSQRARDIMAAAQRYAAETGKTAAAASLVGDLLGDAGSKYFAWLEASGKSLKSQIDLATRINFQQGGTIKEALSAVADFNAMKASLSSIASEFAGRIFFKVDPLFKQSLDYLVANKSEILELADTLAEAVKDVAVVLGPVLKVVGFLLAESAAGINMIGAMFKGPKEFGKAIDKSQDILKLFFPEIYKWATTDKPIDLGPKHYPPVSMQYAFPGQGGSFTVGLTDEARRLFDIRGGPTRSEIMRTGAEKAQQR